MSRDRRVEALLRTATEDLQPLVAAMRELGWPVEIRADVAPDLSTYTVSVVVTVIPVVVDVGGHS